MHKLRALDIGCAGHRDVEHLGAIALRAEDPLQLGGGRDGADHDAPGRGVAEDDDRALLDRLGPRIRVDLERVEHDPHHLLPVGTEELHLLKDLVGGVLNPGLEAPGEMLTTAISISSFLADANLNAWAYNGQCGAVNCCDSCCGHCATSGHGATTRLHVARDARAGYG